MATRTPRVFLLSWLLSACAYEPLAVSDLQLACPSSPSPCAAGETCVVEGSAYRCACGAGPSCEGGAECLPIGRCNAPPVAAVVGAAAVLLRAPGVRALVDASASYDPDGDPLTYAWSLDGCVSDATATPLTGTETVFTFDSTSEVGSACSLTLVVNDGFVDSEMLVFPVEIIDVGAHVDSAAVGCLSTFTFGAAGSGTPSAPYCNLASGVAAAQAYALDQVKLSVAGSTGDFNVSTPVFIQGGYTVSGGVWTEGAMASPIVVSRPEGLFFDNPSLLTAPSVLANVAVYRTTSCDASKCQLVGSKAHSLRIVDSVLGRNGDNTAGVRVGSLSTEFSTLRASSGAVPMTVEVLRSSIYGPLVGKVLRAFEFDGSGGGGDLVWLDTVYLRVGSSSVAPSAILTAIDTRAVEAVHAAYVEIDVVGDAASAVGFEDGEPSTRGFGSSLWLAGMDIEVSGGASAKALALYYSTDVTLDCQSISSCWLSVWGQDEVIGLHTKGLTSLEMLDPVIDVTLDLAATPLGADQRSVYAWLDGARDASVGSTNVHVDGGQLVASANSERVMSEVSAVLLVGTSFALLEGSLSLEVWSGSEALVTSVLHTLGTKNVTVSGDESTSVGIYADLAYARQVSAAVLDGDPGSSSTATATWSSRRGSENLRLAFLDIQANVPAALDDTQRACVLLARSMFPVVESCDLECIANTYSLLSPFHGIAMAGSEGPKVRESSVQVGVSWDGTHTLVNLLGSISAVSDGAVGSLPSSSKVVVVNNRLRLGLKDVYALAFANATGVFMTGTRGDKVEVTGNSIMIAQAQLSRGVHAVGATAEVLSNTFRLGFCIQGGTPCDEASYGVHLDRPGTSSPSVVVNNLHAFEGTGAKAAVVERHGVGEPAPQVSHQAIGGTAPVLLQATTSAPESGVEPVGSPGVGHLWAVIDFCSSLGARVPTGSIVGGAADAGWLPDVDLYGTPRPQGNGDIGAYEFPEDPGGGCL